MNNTEFTAVIITLLLILGLCVVGVIHGIKEEKINDRNEIIMKSECLTYCLDNGWMYSRLLGINEEDKNVCECYNSNVFALSGESE